MLCLILFYTCRQGHLEMIAFLMKKGADPSLHDIEGNLYVSV